MHKIGQAKLPVMKDIWAVAISESVKAGIERSAVSSPDGLYGRHIWKIGEGRRHGW